MFRVRIGEQSYVCSAPPAEKGPMLREAALAACVPDGEVVSGFYWDAVDGRHPEGANVVWGVGGIDELIADQRDLSACCALSETVMGRLRARGALTGPADFAQAISLVVRDPSAKLVYCPDLSGVMGKRRSSGMKSIAVTAETISVVIPLMGSDDALDQTIENIVTQTCHYRVELILVSWGVDADVHERAKEKVGALKGRQIRLRGFSIAGTPPAAYLIDVGVALAGSGVVVVFDPRCRFTKRTTLQMLADWAVGGDVLTVCPAIELNGQQRLCGLSATTARRPHLATFVDGPNLQDARLTAAPTPWTFALNRAAWLGRGGVRGGDGGASWTSSLAYKAPGVGRNIVLLDDVVTLTDPDLQSAQLTTPLRAELSSQANRAIRGPSPFEEIADAASGQSRRRLPRLEPTAKEPLAATFPLARLESGDGVGDALSASSRLRLLVFADMFAASQSIVFEEGLQQARRRGDVSVRIIEDQSATSADLEALVERHMDQTRANIVVLSRLGSMPLTDMASRAAKARGVTLMAHMDDDLLDLPVSAGIERYRKARNPRRVEALLEGLRRADAVLVSTPEMARRLNPLVGAKLKALRFGVAGASSRAKAAANGDLVIGYMGSASHDADLAMIAPALNAVRRDHPNVRLELLGSIAEQPSVALFDPPVAKRGGMIRNYREFKTTLAALDWDIGLAPLRPNAFNMVKTPAKWVEYAEAGIVSVVSNLEPYRPIIDAGAGFSADPDEWATVIGRIIADPTILTPAQAKADRLLIDRFSWSQLEGELLEIFEAATTKTVEA